MSNRMYLAVRLLMNSSATIVLWFATEDWFLSLIVFFVLLVPDILNNLGEDDIYCKTIDYPALNEQYKEQ